MIPSEENEGRAYHRKVQESETEVVVGPIRPGWYKYRSSYPGHIKLISRD